MANFNKVLLMGNLTRDVELRSTQGGTAIAKFGMAINRKWGSGEDRKEETCFVDLTAWGKQAEVINEYCAKGSLLFVEGRLEFSTWEKDGEKKSKLSVVVEGFQLMPRGEKPTESQSRGGSSRHAEAAPDDSIPF